MKWTVKRLAEVQTAFLLLTRLPAGKLNTYVPKLTDAGESRSLLGAVSCGSRVRGSGMVATMWVARQFGLGSRILSRIFGARLRNMPRTGGTLAGGGDSSEVSGNGRTSRGDPACRRPL